MPDGNLEKCKFCQRNIESDRYHCSICNFSIHFLCSTINPPPLTIENLKSHDHTLTLFPRRVPLPCDACGFPLDGIFDHAYACLLCNYMVHRKCIYLPRVIKITRHIHRLSHISSVVPSGGLPCGVCRKTVDVNYGQYSCNKGCHYTVHSKCATRKEVWDGKDLEGVPEEEEEEIEPFVRIDEETIQHFSHDHHYLKIHHHENNDNHENKFCQACILPITASDSFYSCVQCAFVLHETCACLPRKMHHPLHKHPLTLFHPFSPYPDKLLEEYCSRGYFKCFCCERYCCGFMYKCSENNCHFQVDARCASVPDPVTHSCHPHDHPFIFNFTQGKCIGCKSRNCSRMYLECTQCKSFLGLNCATLPCVAHYKHDKHPLTLCFGEEETTNLQHWCDICEAKLDATKWFYSCNPCGVTLHVTCLLGNQVYMKPNHIIEMFCENINITRNTGNTRPTCDRCGDHCANTLVFKWQDEIFCSLLCCQMSM
ncbi:PREDICTED: uncharacterized protein LOC104758329 [Camelina sativa]|uniref:Uncharacterized protein LOC104758329 n=1 Tax=Camelina sativa TaxID=90675 RepID=A0ABM1R6N7_CAMSA|nr:PREDICTED: uncharacterized protein LOC104758329 [Camelina sativa]